VEKEKDSMGRKLQNDFLQLYKIKKFNEHTPFPCSIMKVIIGFHYITVNGGFRTVMSVLVCHKYLIMVGVL
jgi:hypothetical protein